MKAMNSSAIAWVEKLPARWARNAAILAAIVTILWFAPSLMKPESILADNGPPPPFWGSLFFNFLFVLTLLLIVPLAFAVVGGLLIGTAARRHLRALRDMTDDAAHKAITTLPLRYAVWGLFFGFLVCLFYFLVGWGGALPWDNALHIFSNVGKFVRPMFVVPTTATIVGFVSRAALRRRLG
jgi:hypothetical protein